MGWAPRTKQWAWPGDDSVRGNRTLNRMKALRQLTTCRGMGVFGREFGLALLLCQLMNSFGQPGGFVVGWGNNSSLQCSPPPDLTDAVAVAAGEAREDFARAIRAFRDGSIPVLVATLDGA